MKIGILSDEKAGEQRVAASPDMIKKLIATGHSIFIQSGAGAGSSISDSAFEKAGASVSASPDIALFDILLCVNLPSAQTLKSLKAGALVIGQLAPFESKSSIKECAALNLSLFALEWLPRISRAQAMDVLSSQSNLAGYRAVIDAAYEFGKVIPMMMTAAGTVPPAKVLVLGAGVAGLQAIATAKRLGAVVSAFDVRPAVKEQVESLGAKFVEVKAEDAASAETSGGYAKEMSDDYKRKQSELIHETLKTQDMVISTALIPGKPAPVLITEAMVKDMKSGSVIVDLAVASGGNCPLSEADKVFIKHGVKLIGYTNMPSRAAVDASPLYARNLLNFLGILIDKEGKLTINTEDEIIKGTLLCHNGQVVHPNMQ